jgi:hypothetical protein
MAQGTHSPDPTWIGPGAGTAAEQSARPQRVADHENGGWDDAPTEPEAPDKGAAQDGDTFTEATVTAQDATNAAKLGPLGYVASPTTAWTTGQKITVSTFLFSWNGAAWVPGAAAVARTGQTGQTGQGAPDRSAPTQTPPAKATPPPRSAEH